MLYSRDRYIARRGLLLLALLPLGLLLSRLSLGLLALQHDDGGEGNGAHDDPGRLDAVVLRKAALGAEHDGLGVLLGTQRENGGA